MKLSDSLVKEFVKATHDHHEKKENTTCFGTAKFTQDGDYVLIDGAAKPTPATFTVNASEGDRVMCVIKHRKLIVTANVTNPTMTLGTLKANTGIIVKGYLTTNEERLRYDDQSHTGLTFSEGGLGAYGGPGKYWYVKNTGELYASSADISGRITAKEGYLGSDTSGFHIDQYGIYSGNARTSAENGYIALSATTDFAREINNVSRTGLRFAIGSKFGVTAAGKIYAADAEILTGKIGGFDINNGIYSNNKSTLNSSSAGVYLGPDGISLGQDGKFKVLSSGALTATSGTIGSWNIGETAIYKGSETFDSATTVYFGDSGLSIKNKFKVDSTGKLTATGADITGNITATSLVLDGNGLPIGPATGYKVKILNDGVSIVDPDNTTVAYYGAYTQIGADGGWQARVSSGAFSIIDDTGIEPEEKLTISSSGLNFLYNDIVRGSVNADVRGMYIQDNITGNEIVLDDSGSIFLGASNSGSGTRISGENMVVDGAITCNSLTTIGYINGRLHLREYTANPITVQSGNWTDLQSITLTTGLYLVIYGASFETNATGYRQLHFAVNSNTAGRYSPSYQAVSGEQTRINASITYEVSTASATLHLWARQNSGSQLATYGYVKTIKIG